MFDRYLITFTNLEVKTGVFNRPNLVFIFILMYFLATFTAGQMLLKNYTKGLISAPPGGYKDRS